VAILVIFLIVATITGILPLLPQSTTHLAAHCGQTITSSSTLTGNINCDYWGLRIGGNGITLDCAGHTIAGSFPVGQVPVSRPAEPRNFTGIDLENKTGVTVKNCVVVGFYYGYLVANSCRSTLKGNTADGDYYGFEIDAQFSDSGGFRCNYHGWRGSSNTLVQNTARHNIGDGFGFYNGLFVTVTDNTAEDDGLMSFWAHRLVNSTVEGNTANGNTKGDGFQIDGLFNSTFDGNVAEGNKENGFYISAGTSVLINNIARNNGAVGFGIGPSDGFPWISMKLNRLADNTATNNSEGFHISLIGSTLIGNHANGNGGDGFNLHIVPVPPHGVQNVTAFLQAVFQQYPSSLIQNRAVGNSGYGYEDSTSGTRMAGTADTYQSNSCSNNTKGESNPIGLCLAG
jgi:parallel beta-helix repeat protein